MIWFLKDVWEGLTFKYCDGWLDITIAILLWIAVLMALAIVVCFVWLIAYTIYRVIAYDYETVTLPARVTGKKYEPEYTTCTYNVALKMPMPTYHSAEYEVHFVTNNGLADKIDDEELYDWAELGSRFEVTMKIGRDRSPDRKIKYWRVLRYSWY